MADVDRINLRGTRLKEAIGETAGGRAEVNCGQPGDMKVEVPQGVFEFVTAATDELVRRCQRQVICVLDGIAWLASRLTVDEYLPGHDRSLGFFTAFAKPTVHQSLIDTNHGLRIASSEANASFLILIEL